MTDPRDGGTLAASLLRSPVGAPLAVVEESGALRRLSFAGGRRQAEIEAELAGGPPVVWDEARCETVQRQLEEYFTRQRRAFDVPLHLLGTPFQLGVWHELLRIPYGHTVTYGNLARRLGDPRSLRAVGQANRANPIAIVVPCHRVVGASGTLVGYGGGLEVKRFLLELEGARPHGLPRAGSDGEQGMLFG
ncbi:MAG TPA: methylated-DNA--[protein]-cysteine S-methyltransferase [Thermoanaerobaculaceae bacterium]|nr:methylated-DNA--[protein]-cysteine S-methyltransferase [Thermoanaerobaculaceae bacterium]HRS15221.1 methylated-DNA--[protein]-cysteine S-methyltransferase [Thermoanaerobaculaceae bacterium]